MLNKEWCKKCYNCEAEKIKGQILKMGVEPEKVNEIIDKLGDSACIWKDKNDELWKIGYVFCSILKREYTIEATIFPVGCPYRLELIVNSQE
jgi:hypothetical protein